MTDTPTPDALLPPDPSEVERVALAIEAHMFAPHELPLDAELHKKYRRTARAAIAAIAPADPDDAATIRALRDALENIIIAVGMGWDTDGCVKVARAALEKISA